MSAIVSCLEGVALFERQHKNLTSRGSHTAAAFLRSLPELVAAVVAGFVAFRLLVFVAGDTLLTALRVAAFLLAIIYWLIRFIEYRKESQHGT